MPSLSSLHPLPDSSSAEVAPTLSTSSVAVAPRDTRRTLVMLQAVFSLVPFIVGGTRLTSQISLVGPLPETRSTQTNFMNLSRHGTTRKFHQTSEMLTSSPSTKRGINQTVGTTEALPYYPLLGRYLSSPESPALTDRRDTL